jgi:hypothetical protein
VVLAEPVVQVGLAVRVVLAEPVVQVGLAVRGVSEELVVPAGLAELALVPAAVPPKIKSATAAHHRGQVAVQRVEDLRAAAETTREPAAAEAGIAWVAAG